LAWFGVVWRVRPSGPNREEKTQPAFYSPAPPNGHTLQAMRERCGLPYRTVSVDIGAGEQFKLGSDGRVRAVMFGKSAGRRR